MKIDDTDHYAWQDLALEQLCSAQSVLRAAPEDHHDAKDHRQLALKHVHAIVGLLAD